MSTASAFVDTAPETQLKSEVRAKAIPLPEPSGYEAQLLLRKPTPDVYAMVSAHCGVSVDQIKSKDRTKDIVRARHTVAWILRAYGLSYPAIAREMGGHDHTTVLHAVRKIDKERESSERVRAELDWMVVE